MWGLLTLLLVTRDWLFSACSSRAAGEAFVKAGMIGGVAVLHASDANVNLRSSSCDRSECGYTVE